MPRAFCKASRMKRLVILLLTSSALGTAALASAQSDGSGTQSGTVNGSFSLQAMAHQSTAQFPNLGRVTPWDGRSLGAFSYRSIPCRGNAPVNNISSDLPSYGTRVRDSRAPASTRLHNLSFRVVRTKKGVPVMIGQTSIVVCQLRSGPTPNPDPVSDEAKPRIRITWRASFDRQRESVGFHGTFKIVGGTQRYEDLQGTGTIAGYLFCFDPKGCASSDGRYLDAQVSMQGSYRDPTPQL